MNPRVLLAGLAVLLAGALALLFIPPSTSGGAAAGSSEVGALESGASDLGQVDLASAAERAAAEAAGLVPGRTARREVGEEAATTAKAEVALGPELKGRVVDSRGRGVPEAQVQMRISLQDQGLLGLLIEESLAKQATTTDGLGYYKLIGIPNKRVDFTVLADGYARLERDSRVLPDDFTAPIEDLVLAQGVILHGSVVDLSGRAIEGAELFVVDPDRPDFGMRALTHPEPDAISDVEGRFELAQVKVGKWAVEVRATDRPLRTFKGEVPDPGRVSHGLWFEVPDGGTIKGVVRGLDVARFGEFRVEAVPIEGMPFFGGRALERPRSELDGDGRFEIRGLDRDVEHKVKLAPLSNGLVAFAGVTGTRSEEITVLPRDVEVELDYTPGATIKFRAIDAGDKTPVELYTARFGQRANARTITTPSGETRIEHRDGVGVFLDVYSSDAAMWDSETWRLEISAPGYEEFAIENVEFKEGEERDLGEIELQPSGRITVLVKDAADGEPVHSAIVRLTKLSGEGEDERPFWGGADMLSAPVKKTKTDSEGRASLNGFGSEPAELVVSRSRYADFVERIVLGADDRLIEILLESESSVEVIAQDAEGHELGEVQIEHKGPGDDDVRSTQRASTKGRVRFRGLEAGEHSFRLQKRGDGPEAVWQTATLAPGSQITVILIGPSRGTVKGIVREGGQPLGGASVNLSRADGSSNQRWQQNGRRGGRMVSGSDQETGTDGRYSISDLEYGDYVVTVTHDERSMSDRFDVTVDRATVTLDVNLSMCGVEGLVRDRDGRPLVGVELRAVPAEGGSDPRNGFGNWNDWNDSSVIEVGSIASEPSSKTNATGTFRLRGLQAGVPLVLVASHPLAAELRTEPFVLEPDQIRADFVLELTPAGSITVKVVAEGRQGFFQVTARKNPGTPEEIRHDSWAMGGNSARLASLEPGDWVVEVTNRRGNASEVIESRTVSVVAGQTNEQSFTIP